MCKFCDHNIDYILDIIVDATSNYPEYCPFCGKNISVKHNQDSKVYFIPAYNPNDYGLTPTFIFNDIESITSEDSPIYNLDPEEFSNYDSLDIYEARVVGQTIVKKAIDICVDIK